MLNHKKEQNVYVKLGKKSKRDYYSSFNEKTYCDGIGRFLIQNPLGAQLAQGPNHAIRLQVTFTYKNLNSVVINFE